MPQDCYTQWFPTAGNFVPREQEAISGDIYFIVQLGLFSTLKLLASISRGSPSWDAWDQSSTTKNCLIPTTKSGKVEKSCCNEGDQSPGQRDQTLKAALHNQNTGMDSRRKMPGKEWRSDLSGPMFLAEQYFCTVPIHYQLYLNTYYIQCILPMIWKTNSHKTAFASLSI